MYRFSALPLALALFAVAGCETTGAGFGAANARLSSFQIVSARPDDAAEGTCWGNRVTPAIIETVDREVLVQPAQVSSDGRIQQPAIYRKQSEQEIIRPRKVVWTQIVCPIQMNREFIASLQRALSARGDYMGQPTGVLDRRTENAIRRYQSKSGFNEPVLTIETGRALGLIAVERETFG